MCACVNGPLCVRFQMVLCMHECRVRFCSLGSTFTRVYLLKSAGDKHAGRVMVKLRDCTGQKVGMSGTLVSFFCIRCLE